MKYFLGIPLTAAFLALGGFVFTHQESTPEVITGGTGGPTYLGLQQFLGDETIGGNIIASSTSASVTLTGNEFKNANALDYTINVGSVTLTLPASTTAMCSSLTKDERRAVYIRNATTTASSVLTLAGGTGIKLKAATGTAQIVGNTDGSNFGLLTIIRKANTDCDALFIPFN